MEKEIVNGNKLIASFIGTYGPKWGFPDQMGYIFDMPPYAKEMSGKTWYDLSALEFHSSWNWLMPVVEKIEHLDDLIVGRYFSVNIYEGECRIWETRTTEPCVNIFNVEDEKIKAVWKSVVQFIQWYNTNSITTKQEEK